MEQESEGQALQALEFDKKVRREATLGFQQVKSIENHLRFAPLGFLGKADGSDAQALRVSILSASATIVGSFSKVISLLSAPPNCNSSRNNDNFSVDDRIVGNNRAESPIVSTTHTSEVSTPPNSPRRLPPHHAATGASSRLMLSSSILSPAMSPHSGSGISEGGSPPNPGSSPIALDSDGEVAGAGRFRTTEPSTSNADTTEVGEQRAPSRKRKFMPKYTCKQAASGTDQGNDGPPDDGHTWRKYGQKDILGSNYPRSYYRCTHKVELGCPAIKYVQRSDEEPTMFDVTYRGSHTCQAMQQYNWPFPFSPEQLALAFSAGSHHLPRSDHPNTSSPGHLNFPTVVANHNINAAAAAAAAANQAHVLASSSSRDDHLDLLTSRSPSFPLQQTMAGRTAPTSVVPLASSTVPRLGWGSLSKLEPHQQQEQQDLSLKLEANKSPQLLPGNQLNRPSRDSLFGPGSNLLNLLLATSRSQDNVASMNMENDKCRRGAIDLKEPVGPHDHEAGSINTGRPMGPESQEAAQYVDLWRQDRETDDFQSPQLGAADTSKYIFSPVSAEMGHSNNITGSAAERGLLPTNGPSDGSELALAVHTSGSTFTMGYMMDSPVSLMDYDSYIGNSFYGCASGETQSCAVNPPPTLKVCSPDWYQ